MDSSACTMDFDSSTGALPQKAASVAAERKELCPGSEFQVKGLLSVPCSGDGSVDSHSHWRPVPTASEGAAGTNSSQDLSGQQAVIAARTQERLASTLLCLNRKFWEKFSSVNTFAFVDTSEIHCRHAGDGTCSGRARKPASATSLELSSLHKFRKQVEVFLPKDCLSASLALHGQSGNHGL